MTDRTDELLTLRRRLEACDPSDCEGFRQMITDGHTLFDDRQAMAEFFSVTPPTVARWEEGGSTPTDSMRRALQGMLVEQIAGVLAGEPDGSRAASP